MSEVNVPLNELLTTENMDFSRRGTPLAPLADEHYTNKKYVDDTVAEMEVRSPAVVPVTCDGEATTYAVVHNLNTTNIASIQIFDTTDGAKNPIGVSWEPTDADTVVRNRRLNLAPHGAGFESLFVHVVNTTGKALERFDVVGLDGPLETQNLDVFLERIIFKGVAPKKEHKGKFAILQEDAAADMCVRACVFGTTIARIKVESEGSDEQKQVKFCDVTENETGYLTSGGSGAEVLWSDESTQNRWAIIRIGSGSSTLFHVVMEKSGGEAGDHKEQCSFEYDIYDFPKASGDKPIEKAVDLNGDYSKFKRPELGKFKEADFGIALWDDDKLNVVWCNEVMETRSCSNSNDGDEEEGGGE